MIDFSDQVFDTITHLPPEPLRLAFALCKGDKNKGDQLITVVGSFDEACRIAADKHKEAAAYHAHILIAETDPFWLDLFKENPPRPALQWHPFTPDSEASEIEYWRAASDNFVHFWIRKYMVQS